ncbi:MAG: TRAP transporter large permease subunit, partial [Clostridia bacterium]|nr:TRAP transporter large permease subunit [Clostridia bacterium]
ILDAARNTITVALACAAAGLVIGSFNVTGLGMKLSAFIVEVSGGHLLLALVLTSVVSILMGMGMPTTASYIVVGTMAAPALVKMGLLPLAAHLFVFYFAIISAITPPVALAAYAAAGIAKDEPMRIGFTACRLAMGAFIVPFMYAYSPTLIAVGSIPHILWNSFTAGVGVTSLAAAMIGYIRKPASVVERLLFLVGALLLIHPGMITDTTGFILIAIALTVQFGKGRKVPVGAPGR